MCMTTKGTTEPLTTVDLKTTGHVRREPGDHRFEFTFEGDTLRAFLGTLLDERPALDGMLVAETGAEASTDGWTEVEELPGDRAKSPEGEQTRPHVRVAINGTFNEHLDGSDTTLGGGDRVAPIYPFVCCC